jgi:hypothetical protein
MKIMSRFVALFVVSFAAASAFSTAAPLSTAHPSQNGNGAVQTMDLVKCTNPRECSVG